MRATIRLGRIAGVQIDVDWSVLIIFALVTFGLAAGRFPTLFPGLDPMPYLVAGLAAGRGVFASLLAHEVAHAIVARRHGVQVQRASRCGCSGVSRACRVSHRTFAPICGSPRSD